MAKLRYFLTELSAHHTMVGYFHFTFLFLQKLPPFFHICSAGLLFLSIMYRVYTVCFDMLIQSMVISAIELESEKARIQQMQSIYEAQEFSPDDVEKINIKRRELQRQTDEVNRRCAMEDQEIWAEEMALTKEIEQVGKVENNRTRSSVLEACTYLFNLLGSTKPPNVRKKNGECRCGQAVNTTRAQLFKASLA